MKTHCLIISVLLSIFMISCQKNDLNLDFEDIENGLPKGWSSFHQEADFSVSLDSINVKSGKYAIAMEFTGDIVNYHGFTIKLPHYYDGGKITLSGYVKTENVTDGFAGLWLTVNSDPLWKPYEMSFMEQKGITGTTDWKRCEITLDLCHTEGNEIEIGGLLSGKGKMWLDDLKVSIDDKDITKAKLYQPKTFPATEDNKFGIHSNIIFPELTQQKKEDLVLLGRIWGFLKYHHPKIAKGNYNWDYELFRILPPYLKATGKQQRDSILIKWIEQYGNISKGKPRQSTRDAFLKPDLLWIKNSHINLKLKNLLQDIYANRNQGFNYYVKIRPYIGNPIFTNESSYMGKDHHPDAGFRLLSLFRYWNMITYFYPYKYITDKNWDSVLQEYIPYFIEAKTRLEYELVSARLIGEICDSHALLYEGWENMKSMEGARQVPVAVKFIGNQLVVIDSNSTELKKGDIITRINNKPIINIVDSIKPYYPASNEASRLKSIAENILRSDQDHIQIEYIPFNGKTRRINMETVNSKQWIYNSKNKKDKHENFRLIGKDIGYINLQNITRDDIISIKQKLFKTKGLIIDNRCLSSDIFNLLAPAFVNKTTDFAKFTQGNTDNPGEFTFSPIYRIPKSEKFYSGKLVILVNEETVCNQEYTTMAFKAGNNTTIIGSQTGGFDGNNTQIILPGELITFISGNGVYYPNGKGTQRIGIIPDIEVKPSIKGIKEGRDELLEKAIEFINQ